MRSSILVLGSHCGFPENYDLLLLHIPHFLALHDSLTRSQTNNLVINIPVVRLSFTCNNIVKAILSPRARNGTRNWEGLDLYSHYNPKMCAELGNKQSTLLWYGKIRQAMENAYHFYKLFLKQHSGARE